MNKEILNRINQQTDNMLKDLINFKKEANDKILFAIKTLELIAQDPFNGRDGEPDPMKVILRMRVDALNALEKLK